MAVFTTHLKLAEGIVSYLGTKRQAAGMLPRRLCRERRDLPSPDK